MLREVEVFVVKDFEIKSIYVDRYLKAKIKPHKDKI